MSMNCLPKPSKTGNILVDNEIETVDSGNVTKSPVIYSDLSGFARELIRRAVADFKDSVEKNGFQKSTNGFGEIEVKTASDLVRSVLDENSHYKPIVVFAGKHVYDSLGAFISSATGFSEETIAITTALMNPPTLCGELSFRLRRTYGGTKDIDNRLGIYVKNDAESSRYLTRAYISNDIIVLAST